MAKKTVGGYEIEVRGKGRQFRSDFLESMSHCHPLLPLAVYVPIVGICLFYAFTDTHFGAGTIILTALAGIAFWTLAEYVLHRTVFHWRGSEKLHYFIHGIHHQYPNDLGRVVMPPTASAFLAVPIWFICLATMGYATALPFFAGFVIGYLWYDMTHYWTHVAKPKTRYGKMLRRHHMMHHFATPDIRFGVSTPLWDYVFRTHKPADATVDAQAKDLAA